MFIQGIKHLHNSSIRCHGWLNSRNCVIDSRWILKITDFGLDQFYHCQSIKRYKNIDNLLWIAPEILRNIIVRHENFEIDEPLGTQKGDAYSFAIIIQELIIGGKPFGYNNDLTTFDIVKKLRESSNVAIFRPEVPLNNGPDEVYRLMKHCWCEIPNLRPTFGEIEQQVKKFNDGR